MKLGKIGDSGQFFQSHGFIQMRLYIVQRPVYLDRYSLFNLSVSFIGLFFSKNDRGAPESL
jgi:hypothetical protein